MKYDNPHVRFEVCINHTNAAFVRLGTAIVGLDIKVHDSYELDPGHRGTVVLLLGVKPELVEAAKKTMKPIDWRYRSPTWFNNGTLVPYYKTAEEEAAAIVEGWRKRDEAAQKELDAEKAAAQGA